MKSLIFTNFPNGNFRVEFVTDLLHDTGNFTVMEVKGLEEFEKVSSGINFRELPYDVNSFKQFAQDNNLKLVMATQNGETTTVNYTPLALVSSPDLTGSVDIETDLDFDLDFETLIQNGSGGPVKSIKEQEGYTLPAYASINGSVLTITTGAPGTGTHDFDLIIQDDRGEEIEVTYVVTFSNSGE